MTTLNGDIVPFVDAYKYLGTHVSSFEKEWALRKGKAWAVLMTFDPIWRSQVEWDYKRQLFRSLVEPILAYGMCAFPITETRIKTVNQHYGRMLRRALGLPGVRASYNRTDFVHSEQLYGVGEKCHIPFLGTSIRKHRAKMVVKAMREHNSGVRKHVCIDILLFEPSDAWFPPTRGPRVTVMSSLLKDLRVVNATDIADIKESVDDIAESVADMAQLEYWETIQTRRGL